MYVCRINYAKNAEKVKEASWKAYESKISDFKDAFKRDQHCNQVTTADPNYSVTRIPVLVRPGCDPD